MANWDIKASEKFETGWSKITLFTDKKLHKIVFIYLSAILLFYTINILGYPPYSVIGRVIDHSIINFLFLFIGSLWINKILNRKYYEIIFFFFLINSLFSYLVSINYYFSIGYLLNFILIKKLISENEEKMEELGVSFKNLKRNIIIGVAIGFLFVIYGFFIFSLAQGYEFKIARFDRYLEILLGIFIISLFIYTFYIGLIFNYLLKKGLNIWYSILFIALFLNLFFSSAFIENIKDIQFVIGSIFLVTTVAFIYCWVFLLCRNILPIAIIQTISSIVALSFGGNM